VAFTEFCCRSGGSNLNAGTRTGSSTEPGTSADFTYASGTWVQATRVFTVASGNPSSDGVAVGDFASVYPDGSSVGVYLGRVSARDTTTITIDSSANSGTAPTDGTNTRTIKIGGAWAGPTGAVGFPLSLITFSLTNSAGNKPRVNLKNDQIYSVTAKITFPSSVWATQGYTTAYGDFGKATFDGGTSGAAYTPLFPSQHYLADIICKNNGATSNARMIEFNGNGVGVRLVAAHSRGDGFAGGALLECEAYDCNQANSGGLGGYTNAGIAINCISHDNTGSNAHGFNGFTCINCIADTNGGKGFLSTGTVINCDAYNNTSDGFSIANQKIVVMNCNSIKNGGWGFILGATDNGIFVNNRYGAGTQANTSGTLSLPASSCVEEIGNSSYAIDVTPWTDPANGDFRVSLAAAKQTGRGAFMQTAASYAGTIGYPDMGAAQAIAAAAGGVFSRGGLHPIGQGM
jgi:hypothetical protein